jgi:hypothetical protein
MRWWYIESKSDVQWEEKRAREGLAWWWDRVHLAPLVYYDAICDDDVDVLFSPFLFFYI